MRKNVASQKIGVQMVSASDGSAFTGSVTVAVTGDAGTQATGSVGSGACTHEGNGYHTYAPAQAETNYDLIAFTFTGTGAIPATVQVFTTSLNPHDTVRAGLTALPNAAADAAGGLPISDAGGLDLDSKLANTNEVTAARMGALTDWINGGRLDLLLDAVLEDTGTTLDAFIQAIKAKTDGLPSDPADASVVAGLIAAVQAVADAVKLKTDNLPSDPADQSAVEAAIAAGDDATLAAIAGLNNLSAAQVNAEVLDVLNVDTFAEVGQEAPAATNTIRKMIAYLFKAFRNKKTQTSSTFSLYNDAGDTVDQKATVSDDGTTFTNGEIGTGP